MTWGTRLIVALFLAAAVAPSATGQLVPSGVRGSRYAIQFFGTGTGQMDRVKIPIDPDNAADVGNDFTLELWINVGAGNNGAVATGANGDGWITGNILLDRDVYGAGDYGDFGLAIGTSGGGTNRVLAFGANNGTSGETIVGTNNLRDAQWHHIAITRIRTNGHVRMYVDGILEIGGTGPTGDLSYRNGRATGYPQSDPFLVVGAEKHDAGAEYPSFHGAIDELRIWNIALTAEQITNTMRYVIDPAIYTNIVGYWRLEDGVGATVEDSSVHSITGALRAAQSGFPQWLAYTNNPGNTAAVQTPMPPLSPPQVAAGSMSFSWFLARNFRYAIATRSNMVNGESWTPLPGWTNLTGAERSMVFTGSVEQADRLFYRTTGEPYR